MRRIWPFWLWLREYAVIILEHWKYSKMKSERAKKKQQIQPSEVVAVDDGNINISKYSRRMESDINTKICPYTFLSV